MNIFAEAPDTAKSEPSKPTASAPAPVAAPAANVATAPPVVNQPEKNFLVRSVTGRAAAAEGEIAEVLFTKDFVDFSGLDQFPGDIIQWDKSSGKFLYTSTDGRPPFIFLVGAVKAGYDISLDDAWIDVIDGKFEAKVYLPLEPRVLQLKVFNPNRKLNVYRFTYFWLRPPPEIRFKVKEGDKIVQKGTPQKRAENAAFAQLYSGAHPTATVDLDAQKYGNLTFRLYQLPSDEPKYDSWNFVIYNERGEAVAQLDRAGPPPEFIDWTEVGANVQYRGSYKYQLSLVKNGEKYQGPMNTFDTVEGLSLLQHKYSPKFQFEPKEEIGWFSYQDAEASYSNMYIGADLSLAFLNRFIVRGAGNVALHKVNPDTIYTYTRLGAGMRFHGQGASPLLGDPYMYRLDILINSSAYTLRPTAPVSRLTQVSIIVEPHVVFKSYHYVVPWLEYGLKSELSQQRLSLGLSYYFYVRPWSLKLGIGVAYDKLLAVELEEIQFSIFRAMTNFVFYL